MRDSIDHENFRKLLIVQRLERMPPRRRQQWIGYAITVATVGLIATVSGLVALALMLVF